jgi:hypothetical protein
LFFRERSTKTGKPRMCISHFGMKTEFGKLDSQGMDSIEK